MFSEREALRLRFEQLNVAESTVRLEFQKEREKLGELDLIEKTNKSKESLLDLARRAANDLKNSKKENIRKTSEKNIISRETSTSKAAIFREAAIKILNKNKTPISSSDLQKQLEKETGMQITNMTTFMINLMKKYPEVKKPNRGLYLIDKR
ncbi:hypothetical protein ACFVL4_13775 [Bacillus subtilis]